MALVLAATMVAAVSSTPSSATDGHDDLRHHKNRLDNRIDDHRGDLDEISSRLVAAQGRVDTAVADLDQARAELDGLRRQVERAELLDQRMQARLEDAVLRLANARDDLEVGRQEVASKRAELASYAVQSYQTGGSRLLNLGVAFEANSASEAINGMQAGETVMDKQSVALQELQATQVLLKLTEQRVETAKNVVKQNREAAARNLVRTRDLKARAKVAKLNVADRVEALRDVRTEIAEAKAEEIDHIQQLEKERSAVEERLRQIAERRARRHKLSLTAAPTNSGGFLSWPVTNTYITSPYGMRMHPILHVYKLHDGTDFSANCGTPVYAAAAGRVMSTYYNAGYGNRIIIDHGVARGASVWTSYNHLTSFTVHPGEQVSQGELIAYSGTTGYSTGCHLHFMVYVNGSTVDPMNWL